jgi:tRNA nucleotidyltransferase (CCA-adding enzyme)
LEARPLIERLSGERIRHELNHIFLDPSADKIMQRLQELELLKFIHPSLGWDAWLSMQVKWLKTLQPADLQDWGKNYDFDELLRKLPYMVWFLRLGEDDLNQVIRRLKLSLVWAREIRAANHLMRTCADYQGDAPSRITNFLDDFPLIAIYLVKQVQSDEEVGQMLDSYLTNWRFLMPGIDGHALRNLGIPPGPDYRRILGQLRDAWLDGSISSPEEESQLLREILSGLDTSRMIE